MFRTSLSNSRLSVDSVTAPSAEQVLALVERFNRASRSKYEDSATECDEAETLKLYGNFYKMNRRNKRQSRFLICSDQALYIAFGKSKQRTISTRIPLSEIAAITKSSQSSEFTISIPALYDYRFDAVHEDLQNRIISVLSQLIADRDGELWINTIDDTTTAAWTVTKSNKKRINGHHDETVRTVMALDHLDKLGFKSNIARKSLQEHQGNLATTTQALVENFVKQRLSDDVTKVIRSPFRAGASTPSSVKVMRSSMLLSDTLCISGDDLSSANMISPLPSFTKDASESFCLIDSHAL